LLSSRAAVVGIGLATAKQFVEEGAYVYITGRRQPALPVLLPASSSSSTEARLRSDVSCVASFAFTAHPNRLLKKAFSTACALTLISPEAGEKLGRKPVFTQGVESLPIAILGFLGVFQHPAKEVADVITLAPIRSRLHKSEIRNRRSTR
jgi:hypothetical protein